MVIAIKSRRLRIQQEAWTRRRSQFAVIERANEPALQLRLQMEFDVQRRNDIPRALGRALHLGDETILRPDTRCFPSGFVVGTEVPFSRSRFVPWNFRKQ